MPAVGFTTPEPGRGEHREAAILSAQVLGLIVRWLVVRIDSIYNFHIDYGLALWAACASDVEASISAPTIAVLDFLAGANAAVQGLSESPSNFDTSILDRELVSEW